MTSENKAPECGHPFCGETCGSAAIEAPHTQRELDDVPNGEREAPPELAEGMRALKALLARIVAAEAELTAERAKVARLVDVLKACVFSLERADTAEGVCCCGDNMESHGDTMNCGHSPVDMGDYYARKALEAARAAIGAYEVQP